jgi:outer membrane protein assembly factor BamB
MRRTHLVLLSTLLLAGPAAADHWPRFRGPNGSGTAADKNIPVRWTADGVLWKVAVPGAGHSSPVVWGDHLFLQTATDDGKERQLLCYDAVDGKLRWSRTVPGGRGQIHKKSSLASSTPATDGERVYVLFWDGKGIALHAYDFAGSPLWQRGLGPYVSQHGVGMSPMTYGGKVYLINDQDGSAAIIALDAKTGQPAWQQERRAFRACSSTPLVLEEPGREPELVVVSTAGITSYHPHTGAENWTWGWTFPNPNKPLRTVSSPIVSGGLVFATSGDGGGDRYTVAVRLGGKGDVSRTNLVWEKAKTLPYVPTLLAHGEHVYYVNDAGLAGCVVAKTGEEVWNARLCKGVSASPVLIDGKVYVTGEEGVVYVYPAATSFKLLAKNDLGEPITASPAVADGRLFIRGHQHLFCIGAPAAR